MMYDKLDRKDPWWKRVYWFVVERLNPLDWGWAVKWFVQRGRRGWADRDLWGLDYYLVHWLPDALRRLKDVSYGVPSTMFENPEEVSDEAVERAREKWHKILGQIIDGFEAYQRVEDGLYESELGKYPLRRPAEMSLNAWEQIYHERFLRSEVLRRRDMGMFREGMRLFVEHFGSLWN